MPVKIISRLLPMHRLSNHALVPHRHKPPSAAVTRISVTTLMRLRYDFPHNAHTFATWRATLNLTPSRTFSRHLESSLRKLSLHECLAQTSLGDTVTCRICGSMTVTDMTGKASSMPATLRLAPIVDSCHSKAIHDYFRSVRDNL